MIASLPPLAVTTVTLLIVDCTVPLPDRVAAGETFTALVVSVPPARVNVPPVRFVAVAVSWPDRLVVPPVWPNASPAVSTPPAPMVSALLDVATLVTASVPADPPPNRLIVPLLVSPATLSVVGAGSE